MTQCFHTDTTPINQMIVNTARAARVTDPRSASLRTPTRLVPQELPRLYCIVPILSGQLLLLWLHRENIGGEERGERVEEGMGL